MRTVLTEAGEFAVTATDGLWLRAEDAERATGWVLKPEGMCQGDVGAPLPQDLRRADRVDMAAFCWASQWFGTAPAKPGFWALAPMSATAG